MGSDAPLTYDPPTLMNATPAPDAVPSTNFSSDKAPETLKGGVNWQLFQKSLVVTPVAANPVLLVSGPPVKATSMREPAFEVMAPARRTAAKNKLRHLKLCIIRSFG